MTDLEQLNKRILELEKPKSTVTLIDPLNPKLKCEISFKDGKLTTKVIETVEKITEVELSNISYNEE